MHAARPGPTLFRSAACMHILCIMMINNLSVCIKAFFIMKNRGRCGVRSCPKKSHRDFYDLFYCNCDSNSLPSYQIMSSPPQTSHSQIDPSLTSAVSTLIPPFSALSIEPHREEGVVESRASKILEEGEFLLDNEVYISTSQVVKRKQRTFWAFAHGEEVIRKSNNTTSWLCGLCKDAGRIKLYSSTSTAWMGDHLIKIHKLSKATTQSSSSQAPQIQSTTSDAQDNARSLFIPITPEQYSKFRLTLITWMVKKHISYSQVFFFFQLLCLYGTPWVMTDSTVYKYKNLSSLA